MIPLKVIENFGHLSICLDIAAQKQQTHCWYFWVGIAREGFLWQQETGSAPQAFLCLRGAGATSVAIGAGGTYTYECRRAEAGRVGTQHWW